MVDLVTTRAASGDLAAQRELRDTAVADLIQAAGQRAPNSPRHLFALARAECAARVAISHPDSTDVDAASLLSLLAIVSVAAGDCGDVGMANDATGEGIALTSFIADSNGEMAELAGQSFNELVAGANPAELQAAFAWEAAAKGLVETSMERPE